MTRSATPYADVISAEGRMHWLCEVEIGGVTYRASDEDLVVTDANGTEYLFLAGLQTDAMTSSMTGDTSIELAIDCGVSDSEGGWPLVVARAGPPYGSKGRLLRWAEGQAYDEARAIFAGIVVDEKHGGRDEAITLTLESVAGSMVPIPPTRAEISPYTWPSNAAYEVSEALNGAMYPLVIGSPGGSAQWGSSVYAAHCTPGYLTDFISGDYTSKLLIAWVPDGTTLLATTVSVYVEIDGFITTETMTIAYMTDLLGVRVAYVLRTSAFVGWLTSIQFLPQRKYWIKWPAAGAVRGLDGTSLLRKAGEVIHYLMQLGGVRVDVGRMSAARAHLDRYLLDFAIVERVDNVLEFIDGKIGKVIPLARRSSGEGFWYELIRYDPRPEEAVLHLYAPRSTNVGQYDDDEITGAAPVVRVNRDSGVGWTSWDDVINEVTVRYAPTRGNEPTRQATVTGGTPDDTAAPAGYGPQEYGSAAATVSRARFGRRVGEDVEVIITYDDATAAQIAQDIITRSAWPRRMISYSGSAADLETAEVNTFVRVTDLEEGIDAKMALITACTHDRDRVVVDLEVLDGLQLIGPSMPEELSYAEAFPGADLIFTAYDVTGATVSSLRDISGNGNHATVVTGSAPTITSAYTPFGGRPAIVCSGGSIATTATFGADTDCTFVCAFYDPGVTGSFESPGSVGVYSSNISLFRDGTDVSEWTMGVVEAGAPYGQVVTAADAAPHVLVFRRVGDQHTVWVDGAVAATKTGNTTATTADVAIVGSASGGADFGGAVAFMGYWPRPLSNDDIRALSTRIWRGALGQAGSLP